MRRFIVTTVVNDVRIYIEWVRVGPTHDVVCILVQNSTKVLIRILQDRSGHSISSASVSTESETVPTLSSDRVSSCSLGTLTVCASSPVICLGTTSGLTSLNRLCTLQQQPSLGFKILEQRILPHRSKHAYVLFVSQARKSNNTNNHSDNILEPPHKTKVFALKGPFVMTRVKKWNAHFEPFQVF